MEYELKNPSDPYTFIAEDLETAALLVFSISTMYGAEAKDGSADVPIFIFGGAKEWYVEQFGRTPDEGREAKKSALAAALSSMMYGNYEDRRRYSAALEAITDPEKKEKFIEEWQDGHSSLNDIGTYAHKLAKKFSEEVVV
jgi:hypothetical protein